MTAERANSVDAAWPRGRIRPANGASDNACHSGTQPSQHGSNGARAGAENYVDNACHSETQPSPHGGNRASAEAPAESARHAMGRFAPGNQGGPGNPFGRLMGMLRCALVRRNKPVDVEAIADVLIEKAKAGDVPAARLVLSYGIGRPSEAVHTSPDAPILATNACVTPRRRLESQP